MQKTLKANQQIKIHGTEIRRSISRSRSTQEVNQKQEGIKKYSRNKSKIKSGTRSNQEVVDQEVLLDFLIYVLSFFPTSGWLVGWLVCWWLAGWLAGWLVGWLVGLGWVGFGLVWFGLVWCGVVWFGLGWLGLVWFD